MRKTINGIEYLVYEEGISLNQPNESFFFENDLIYEGELNCLNYYALKSVIVRGNQ